MKPKRLMFLNEFVNFAQEQQCTCDLKILRKKKHLHYCNTSYNWLCLCNTYLILYIIIFGSIIHYMKIPNFNKTDKIVKFVGKLSPLHSGLCLKWASSKLTVTWVSGFAIAYTVPFRMIDTHANEQKYSYCDILNWRHCKTQRIENKCIK